MDEVTESQKLEQAIRNLVEAFPGEQLDEIAAMVHAEHHRFDGRPVRDYVPLLVERSVRARLKRRHPVPV